MTSRERLPTAIFLMGPTAAGKTDLAVQLVARLHCAIISVDSAMVYRGMDIGTAKPSPEVLRVAPHRLIDMLDPAESYSAARFRSDALREMGSIRDADATPLLVGGTMLYFRALQQGLSELPSADPAVRERLFAEAGAEGWPALHRRLAAVDPEAARRIHPNDPQRIQRALEVYELSGRPLTVLQRERQGRRLPYRVAPLAVAPAERAVLHQRIAERFRVMLAEGLIEEVEALRQRGDLDVSMPALRAVGYRQVWDYLAGRCTHAELVERGIIATRQLAKRQLTWLRAWPGLQWFDSRDRHLTDKVLKMLSSVAI